LTIPLGRRELNRFENFYGDRNLELIERLRALACGSDSRPLGSGSRPLGSGNRPLGNSSSPPGYWLWGEPGRGRSHLLQACCQAVEVAGGRAIYLPLQMLPRDRAIIEDLEAQLIAVDDLDSWAGDSALEDVIMAIYQDSLVNGSQLLFSARHSAQRTPFVLPDLASRMRALPGFEVLPPDDEGLRQILMGVADRQGLELAPSVLDYWLHRSVRALPVLLRQFEQLDARALAEQRRVTIPLIKEVLAL